MNIKRNFYIYQYVDRYTGIPFYIGKGKDGRMNSHLNQAKKGNRSALYDRIRQLGFEQGVIIKKTDDNLTENEALSLECEYIKKLGRVLNATGSLLNQTSGGEGISGGIDMYGYKKSGIARKITDMVDKGIYIQDMPAELLTYVKVNRIRANKVVERIIPHLQEMGNVGSHYKGPKLYLRGWQFSLNQKMVDINKISLTTKGFLKVHGDLPFNNGYVANAPRGYDFGYRIGASQKQQKKDIIRRFLDFFG